MCMNEVYTLFCNKFFYCVPTGDVKWSCCMNNMNGYFHFLQPFNHRAFRKRKDNRLKLQLIKVFNKAEQVRFAATDLSLTDTFQNPDSLLHLKNIFDF